MNQFNIYVMLLIGLKNPSNGLTRETFHGVEHTTLAMIELVQYLLNTTLAVIELVQYLLNTTLAVIELVQYLLNTTLAVIELVQYLLNTTLAVIELVQYLLNTTLAVIELVQYLLNPKNEINFVLLGLIQSDFLEGRFGRYRQLNGGNYYASVLQFLQAEKTIRLRSLVEFGYNMSAIDAICSEVKENDVLKDTICRQLMQSVLKLRKVKY